MGSCPREGVGRAQRALTFVGNVLGLSLALDSVFAEWINLLE